MIDQYGSEALTPQALRARSRMERLEMMEYYVTHGYRGENLRDYYSYWQGDQLVVLREADFGHKYETTYDKDDLLAWFADSLKELRLALKEHRMTLCYQKPDRRYDWADALLEWEGDHLGKECAL
jgi:hypothetical protein